MKEHSFGLSKGRDADVFHNWLIKYAKIYIPGTIAKFSAWVGMEVKEEPAPKRPGHFRYIPVNDKRLYVTSFGTTGVLNHPTEVIKIPSPKELIGSKHVCDLMLWDSYYVQRIMKEETYKMMIDYLRSQGVGKPGTCNCRGCIAHG